MDEHLPELKIDGVKGRTKIKMSYIRLLYHALLRTRNSQDWNRPAFQAVAVLWYNFLRSLTLGYENKTPLVSIGLYADNY